MSDRIIHRAKVEGGGKLVLDDSPTQLYPWWSFTKTAIAACALQIVAQGRLELDAPLPDRLYTLHQILQHRAGIPEYGKLASYHEAVERGDKPWTVNEMLERVDANSLAFTPGEDWSYSNVGYLFVRQIIEETVGDDISTALQTLVFNPLDIHSVRLVRLPSDLDGTAWGNKERYHPGWVYHGLLIGTALDAVRFLDGLMSGRLLRSDLLDTMKIRYPISGKWPGRPWVEAGYGLGLMNGRMVKAGRCFGHSGVGPGSVSAVFHFPECQSPCTVAAFAQGGDEGVNEHAVVDLAAQI